MFASTAGDIQDDGTGIDHEFPYDLLGNDLEGTILCQLYQFLQTLRSYYNS